MTPFRPPPSSPSASAVPTGCPSKPPSGSGPWPSSGSPPSPWPATGPVDRLVRGLSIGAAEPPGRGGAGRRPGRRRPGRGGEPLLAPPQSRRPRRGGLGPRRPAGHPPPPRPPLAAAPVPGRSAAAGRPAVEPRDHQRAEPATSWPTGASPPPPSTTPSHVSRHGRGVRGTAPGATTAGRVESGGTRRRATTGAWCCSPPGPSPARTWPAAWRWPPSWSASTGCSGRPRTGTAPSSTPWWRGRVPGRPGHRRTRATGVTVARRLPGLRRGGTALHLGGLRQSDHRVGRPPAPAGHRALPGGRRAGRLRLRLVRPGRDGAAWRLAGRPRPRACWTATWPWPPPISPSRDLPDRIAAVLPAIDATTRAMAGPGPASGPTDYHGRMSGALSRTRRGRPGLSAGGPGRPAPHRRRPAAAAVRGGPVALRRARLRRHHHGRHRRVGRRDQAARVPALRVQAGALPRADGRRSHASW